MRVSFMSQMTTVVIFMHTYTHKKIELLEKANNLKSSSNTDVN